jgi:hypothetical protein
MPHDPASIVRLLYGERTLLYGERTAEEKTFSLPNNSLTSAPPIGQGHRCKSASHYGSRFVKPLEVPVDRSKRCSRSKLVGPCPAGVKQTAPRICRGRVRDFDQFLESVRSMIEIVRNQTAATATRIYERFSGFRLTEKMGA